MFTTNRESNVRMRAVRGALGVAILLGAAGAATAQPAIFVTTVQNGNIVAINNGDTVTLDDVAVGDEVVFLFQIRDGGDQTLAVSSLSATPVDDTAETLDAGFTQIFNQFAASLRFRPLVAGLASADVEIHSNDPASPFSFRVQVLATGSQLIVADNLRILSADEALDIEAVEVGQSGGAVLTVRNFGNGPLTFGNVFNAVQLTETTGGDVADFVVELPTGTIPPGGFGVMTVAFTPSSVGPRAALAEISSNDPESPYLFAILAEGLAPPITDCNFNGVDDAEDLAAGTSTDCNVNAVPDECETDTDGDGFIDDCDECPGADDALDGDADQIPDCLDNCPEDANPDQLDSDDDGVGDACTELPPVEEDPIADEPIIEDPIDNVDTNAPPPVDEEDVEEFDGGGFCGAGALGFIPMMMFGLCGLKTSARNRRR